MGRVLYHKLMPKPVKEGGQSRTFDCACARPQKQSGGAAKFAASPLSVFRPSLASIKRETRFIVVLRV